MYIHKRTFSNFYDNSNELEYLIQFCIHVRRKANIHTIYSLKRQQ